MNFSIEKYKDIVPEISKLYAIAVDEIVSECPYDADVDHDQFIEMDEMDLLQVITARENDELIGFHISTITNDIFYKDKKTAYVMHYYLMKEHRGGGRGLKLFEYAEKVFNEKNIDRTFMSRKTHINNEKMFDALGYNQIEANYEKYYE